MLVKRTEVSVGVTRSHALNMFSEKIVVEVFTLRSQYLPVNGFLVTSLRLRLSELYVCCLHIRVLWFVEFVSILEFFFKDGQVRPARLPCLYILFRDLRLDLRGNIQCALCAWCVLNGR